jgi:DUF971 family protein
MANDPGIFPVSLQVKDGDRLVIEWNDGKRQELSWSVLRRNCPCAGCRTEREKPAPLLPILKLEEAQPAKPRSIVPVGRYAYQFHWNDGHESGIYTFDMLRQLGDLPSTSQRSSEPAG